MLTQVNQKGQEAVRVDILAMARDLAKRRISDRTYHVANRALILDKKKKYRLTNAEQIRISQSEYRTNIEKH